MAQRISSQEYESQGKDYTKKALAELYTQMKSLPNNDEEEFFDNEDEGDSTDEDYVPPSARVPYSKIINLATENARMKSRIEKLEKTNYYLKLDLANASVDQNTRDSKIQSLTSKNEDYISRLNRLFWFMFFCLSVSLVGTFLDAFVVNNVVYLALAAAVEFETDSKNRCRFPLLTPTFAGLMASAYICC